MDKIKPYLRVAIKHHFWILCGLIAILTLGSWYTTSASLTSQFQTNKGKIKSAEDALQAISSRQNHPNPNYHDNMDKMINAYKDNLRVLWENQYLNQGHNLKWPVQTATEPGLTKDFVEQVEPLRPIETTVPYDPTNKGLDKL
ncbi:MAG TPA: hypothetical protein VL096_01385, partial [Pirellulaceae bacterium]|nr:hypothetical protein [Pirellulaceae bacterium]